MEALEKKLGRIIPDLFPHLRGAHKGTPTRNFRKAWGERVQGGGGGGGAPGTISGARRCGTSSTPAWWIAWP